MKWKTRRISHGRQVSKTERALALDIWQSITAGLTMRKECGYLEVNDQLPKVPKPHIRLIQLAIRGAGYATPNFDPDGVWGTESATSLENLWKATQEPITKGGEGDT